MKDKIEQYVSDSFRVLEQTPGGVTIRLSARVHVDQAVAFRIGERTVWGRVVRARGNERVDVQTLGCTDDLTEADDVAVYDAPPSLPLPWDVGPIPASELGLSAPGDGPPWPPAPVAMMEVSGRRQPITTGFEALDLLAPLVAGGFNLVIDAHRERTAFDRLVASAVDVVDIDVRVDDVESSIDTRRRIHADGNVDDYEAAMAAALAWIAHERQARDAIVAVLELPVVVAEWGAQREATGLGPSSRIADAVTSTRGCDVTCLVRLPAATGPEGFADIVETLALGDVDAQLFIDSRGRFEPTRSQSSVPVEPEQQRKRSAAHSTLHRAERAADRLSLWGEDELADDEARAIAAAEAMRESLIDS
jgi:hypothetical protein